MQHNSKTSPYRKEMKHLNTTNKWYFMYTLTNTKQSPWISYFIALFVLIGLMQGMEQNGSITQEEEYWNI